MPKLPLDLNQPTPQPKTLEEAQKIIGTLWQVVADLVKQIEALTEQLSTSSENSSQPPSKDSPKQRAKRPAKKPTGKKKGAQVGHPKHERALVPETEVDQIYHYYPQGRCWCGGTVVTEKYRRHQVFDLPQVKFWVTEHRCYQGTCQQCQLQHRAGLTDDIPRGQIGPGLIVWISLLNSQYHSSLRQVEQLLEQQWSLKFSLGAISEAQELVLDWLLPIYHQIGEIVRRAPLAHADEFSQFGKKSRYWLWSLSTPQAAHALLGDFDGILVTDRHGAYNDYAAHKHQYCWAHIIRNLEKIAERRGG